MASSNADEGRKIFDNQRMEDLTESTMNKLIESSRVEAAFGQPINHGDTLIIPTAEVLGVAGIGYGGGGGYGAADPEKQQTEASYGGGKGGGGGGRTFARPVAVVIASPECVRVEPVVDVTKLWMAAVTAAGFMIWAVFSMRNTRKVIREFKKQAKELQR